MRITRKWRAVVLLAGLGVFMALAARAADVGEGTKARAGGRTGQQIIVVDPTDSTRYLLEGGAGGMSFNDTDRDRDQLWFYTDIINNTALSATQTAGMSDSSAMLPTTGWKHMALWVYPTCTGGGTGGNCDSVFYATYAIQVRGGTAANNDSIGAHPWTRARNGSANAADTVGGNWTTFGFDSLQTRADPATEFILVANLSREKSVQPYGYYVPLVDPRSGAWFSAPYTSIRIRALDVFNGSMVVFREGSPDNRTRVRVDLVGWR